MLIEAWNHNFFLRRSVHFRFSKVRARRHNRRRSSRRGSRYGSEEEQEFSEDDSDSMSSESDDDGGDPYDDRSRKRSSRRRRDKDATYRLLCEFIAPTGAGRGGLPPGYPAGYA